MSIAKISASLALSASLLFGAAAPAMAADSPTFATFRELCVANRANVTRVIARADANGWDSLPAGSFDTSSLKDFTRVEVRVRTDEGLQLLLAGEGVFPMSGVDSGEMQADLCIVGVQGGDGEQLRREAQAFTRVQPDAAESDGDTTLWIYSDASGRRTSLSGASDADAVAAVRTGKVEAVMLETSDDLTMIGFIIPRL